MKSCILDKSQNPALQESRLLTTILDVAKLLRNRSVSPMELVDQSLARIERLNPTLNAFITIMADSALTEARQAEAEILRGDWRGPLHGIPIGLKDLIDTAGVRTTAASAVFKDRVPQEDAEVVRRLKAAGAIILGKQNLHEFAYGGSSIISYYGEVHNPWDRARIAGGSSGGSAAAVAAGLGYGAIGTDTAGSIREPASQCGVVGLKPTYGRVSPRGVIPLSQSLDHVGPIARTVSDVAVILQAIAEPAPGGGESHLDFASSLHANLALRVGVPRPFFFEDLDPEVAATMEESLRVIKSLAADVKEVSLPVDTDRTLQTAEAYMYHVPFIEKTPELYQAETLRRIQAGNGVSWAAYTTSLRRLKEARHEIGKIFESVELLVTPATPIPAPVMSELKQDLDLLRPRELLLLRNTRPFNVWGLPAISVPCGFTRAGLPIGLQIAGPHWGEATVLQLAHAYEQATEWHKRQP
jgi:aspartyl-tRNA(Asn)/glutamyl-tRNA(Gln) amidotransferase subunit A